MRNDSFSTWLSVLDSLNQIDFNLLVKETTLNLSDRSVNWKELIDSNNALHIERYVPYLNLDFSEDENLKIINNGDNEKNDIIFIRQIGFLEDENIRLRRSILQQLNYNSLADAQLTELTTKFEESKLYAVQLELEVQRLYKIKFELEEQISANEATNKNKS